MGFVLFFFWVLLVLLALFFCLDCLLLGALGFLCSFGCSVSCSGSFLRFSSFFVAAAYERFAILLAANRSRFSCFTLSVGKCSSASVLAACIVVFEVPLILSASTSLR